MDLRYLVEVEGQNGPVEFAAAEPSLREQIVLLVRTMYRPARALLRIPAEAESGRAGMVAFADASLDLEEQLREAGDLAGALLARHNAASACGFVQADKRELRAINRGVLYELKQLEAGGDGELSEDLGFVKSKVFFGLMENDPEFKERVPADDWAEMVDMLRRGRYPDYPGRALELARTTLAHDGQEDAVRLLTLATSREVARFGKADQIADAVAELGRLGRIKVLPP